MRLIDADAVVGKMKRFEANSQIVSSVIKLIERQPTIDTEPVRHGRWEYQYNDSICSACGYVNRCEPITRYRNDSPYCPNCGAKMDGGKDDLL